MLRKVILFSFYLALILSAFSEYAQISRVKYTQFVPRLNHYNIKETTIIYPIFSSKNQFVGERINRRIKQDFQDQFHILKNTDLQKMLVKAEADGLTDLDLEITRSDHQIFSFSLLFQGMGAYPSSWRYYYSFDPANGHLLTLDTLIRPEKMVAFLDLMKAKQDNNIRQYKQDLQSDFNKGDIDSSTYQWTIQALTNN